MRRRRAPVAARVQFGDPGCRRSRAEPGREAAQNARDEERRSFFGEEEDERRGNREADCRQHRDPSSDLVGEPADAKERDQIAEHIDGVDEGKRQAAEAEGAAVKRIERGRQCCADEQNRERTRDHRHRNRAPRSAVHRSLAEISGRG
jgi:hypothetical protein